MSIGLLERPLFIGLLWSLVTGDYDVSLKIAIFFELAWLDIIPAGTYIPPHLGAAMFTALALTSLHGLTAPGEIALVMAAGIPMAWLGTRLEAAMRYHQGRYHSKAMQWAATTNIHPFPERLIYNSIVQSFIASWGFFFICLVVLNTLVCFLLGSVGSMLDNMHVIWPHLWLAASIGGLLALRVNRAYAVFFTGATLVGLLIFFVSL